MSTVFISSVISGFEDYRQAAREAIELLDHKPIMSEHFGARPYSSETACIAEVENSDVYLLILGDRCGYQTPEGVSVTQAEFRAARAANRPVLAFIQNCEMEPPQIEFKQEVEAYQEGFFRSSFTTTQELRDQVIRSLRQLETRHQSISEEAFRTRITEALKELDDSWDTKPELVLAFLPQPERMVDIVGLEDELDAMFQRLCAAGLSKLRDGYEALTEAHWTGLKTAAYRVACFPDGLILLLANPTVDNDSFFAGQFAPPNRITEIATGFRSLIDATSGYLHIGLRNMGNTYVAPLPEGTSFSVKMMGEEEAAFDRLFVPLRPGAYDEWVSHCVKRFQRIFAYKN